MNHTITNSQMIRTRDGSELYVERTGDGSPTVVFEAGMGSSRSAWAAVTAALSGSVQTVVYDRSGLGRSAPTDGPRDLAALAGDLGELLDQLGPGPFVLVGHSWGGPIVRVAAAARPERISGLVLVDATDERCDLFFSDSRSRSATWVKPLASVAARVGLFKLPVRKLAGHLPPDAAASMRAEDATPDAVRASMAEMATWTADLLALRHRPPGVPDIPVTIISGGRSGRFDRAKRAALVEAHRHSAIAAPQGRHVIASASAHYVPFTEPQIVADEIMRIIDPPPPGATS